MIQNKTGSVFRFGILSKITLFSMILLISLLSISSQNVDATTGYLWAVRSQDDNPIYCVMVNPVYKNYYWYIYAGVKDWERELHAKVSTPTQRALWDMQITFVDEEYDACVMVYLDTFDNAPTMSNGNKALGLASNYRIVLYIVNEQEGESVRQVMSHEVGHTLGLGHYEDDDEKLMNRWGLISHAPSIMIPTQYWNKKLQGITDNDINKIREVYGDGFYKPIPPPPKYEPPVEKPQELQINPSEFSIKEIVVKRGQYTVERISGTVFSEMTKGEDVDVTTVKPDNTRDIGKVRIRDYFYEYPIMFDYLSLRGTYYVVVNYKDQEVNKQGYFVTDTPTLGNIIPHQETSIQPAIDTRQSIQNYVAIKNTDYTITPKITGGVVKGIEADIDSKSIRIVLETTSEGVLTMTLSRDLIDSTTEDGKDYKFFVLTDGAESNGFTVDRNEMVSAFVIPFSDGTTEIEIIGTHVTPEFNSVILLVLVMGMSMMFLLRNRLLNVRGSTKSLA